MKRKMTMLLSLGVLSAAILSGCGENAAKTEIAANSQPAAVQEAAESVNSVPEEPKEAKTESTAERKAEEPKPTEEAQTESNTISEPEPLVLSETLKSSDDLLQVLVPSDWERMEQETNESSDLVQDFPLSAKNQGGFAFIMGNTESKVDTAVKSFDEYTSVLLDGVKKSDLFTDVAADRENEPIKTKSGIEGTKNSFSAVYIDDDNKEISIHYIIYTLNGEKGYIQVNCWSDEAHAENEEAVFDAIVQSLTELSEAK